MKLFTGVKVAVFDDSGQVLLLRRSATDDRRAGEWDMPGGGVEPGEDIAAGAVRETLEEAGIMLEPSQLKLVYAGTTPHPDRGRSISRILFVVRLPGRPPVRLSHEHEAYEWAPLDVALDMFPHPFYNQGLRYANDHQLLGTRTVGQEAG